MTVLENLHVTASISGLLFLAYVNREKIVSWGWTIACGYLWLTLYLLAVLLDLPEGAYNLIQVLILLLYSGPELIAHLYCLVIYSSLIYLLSELQGV